MKNGFELKNILIPTKGSRFSFPGKQLYPQVHGKNGRRRMKILRLIARLNIGGPAIHVHLLTQGLDPERFETTLVAGRISSQEGDMAYLFDRLDKKPIFIPEMQREIRFVSDLKSFFHVLRIINRHKPDIIHTHTAKAGTQARLGALFYKLLSAQRVKTVHTFHGHVFEGYFSKTKTRLYILIERLLAHATDVIIAISNGQKQELAGKYHIASPQKIKTIALGFDLSPFLDSRQLEGQFRSRLQIDNDTFLIGTIGRLVHIKNHRMFLFAARQFITANPDFNCHFAIIGDGELKGELSLLSQRLGIQDRVSFCGWVRDVPGVYADLDLLALTSQNEGTPVSIIEAMAAGVPVISTDAGGVVDLLGPFTGDQSSNGFRICKRGILSRKNDPLAFAEGMTYLSCLNGYERHHLITNAHRFVMQHHNRTRLITEIENLYSALMQDR